jgi:V/A-type H+-transporting ATPase subunit I
MLSPEPMRHLSLVVIAGDLEGTTRVITRVGVLHLLNVCHLTEMLGTIRPYDVSERLAQLEALLRPLNQAHQFFGIEAPEISDLPAIAEHAGEFDLQAVQQRVEVVSGEVDALRMRSIQTAEDGEHLQNLLRNLRALAPLGLPLENLRGLRYVYLTSGLLPERNLGRLRDSLARLPHLIAPAAVGTADRRVLVTALCLRAGQPTLERALRSAQFERLELPQLSGTPEDAIRQVEQQLTVNRNTLAAISEERRALGTRVAAELQTLHVLVARERLLVEARGLMGHSERIALISGWVPAAVAGRLEQAIRAATAGRCVLQWREPTALEDVRRGRIAVPILMRNPVLIRPFERLLRNYGMPRYGEVDPTAVVAVAFLAMFGFMFGDVGQGAVLFAIGYFIYRRMFRYRDYAVILMECGVFAGGFGFLYGSVFGVEGWLPALWLRPLHDTETLIKTALAFGVAFLSVGLALNFVNAFRRGDVSALWERNGLLAALAYWVAVALCMRRLTAGPDAVTLGTAALWLAVPMSLILLKEPLRALWRGVRERRWPDPAELFALGVESLVEVLDTAVSAISNTATFIRLAAFALSHAGLFLATYSVADAVSRSAAGSLGAALVIVIGNAVIIGLEGLIVAIQSVRLEYYEFFSKFYSGGGEEYRPLRFASASPVDLDSRRKGT